MEKQRVLTRQSAEAFINKHYFWITIALSLGTTGAHNAMIKYNVPLFHILTLRGFVYRASCFTLEYFIFMSIWRLIKKWSRNKNN